MLRKGVAVPYIIAIVLGVVVIGLIGYWLFISGGNFGTTSTKAQCNQKLLTYCSEGVARGTSTPATPWDTTCNTILGVTGTPETLDCSKIGVSGFPSPTPTR